MIDLKGLSDLSGVVLAVSPVFPMRGLKDGKEFVYHWHQVGNVLYISQELLDQLDEAIAKQNTGE